MLRTLMAASALAAAGLLATGLGVFDSAATLQAASGRAARLPFDADGFIPERTLILTGTPGGTVFKGIYPSAYVRGGLAWLAGGWKTRSNKAPGA